MLLKCELMLQLYSEKYTGRYFKVKDDDLSFASYKMFRMGIEILILSFNYFKLSISKTMFALAHTSIALAHTLVALTHLNSTKELHRLQLGFLKDCLYIEA